MTRPVKDDERARTPRPRSSDEAPASNRRGQETRWRVLAASIELLDDLELADLLALLPTAAIAQRADRSERAVRHHFSSSADFQIALSEVHADDRWFPHATADGIRPRGSAQRDCATSDDELVGWAVRCHPLFATGVEQVSWADLAGAANADPSTFRLSFQTKSVVAATAFSRHLDRVRAALTRHLGKDADRPLADALCEIARSVRDDPHCAAALLRHRIDPELVSALPIHRLAPFDRYVSEAGQNISEVQARRMVDTCLALACANPRTAPGVISTWALGVA